MTDDPMKYWLDGAKIVEDCLKKAIAADPADVPFPLVDNDARLWHLAQMNAYRHALEMMGPPADMAKRIATIGGVFNYDSGHGGQDPIAADATARFTPVPSYSEFAAVGRVIALEPEPDEHDSDPYYLTAREARCLAAQLLRSAEAAEQHAELQRANGVGPGTEFPELIAAPVVATAPNGAVTEGVGIARKDT